MWQDIKEVYTCAWRAAFLLPLVFVIPALVEFAQHLIEINAGMYESRAAAKAAGDDPLRMMFGLAKGLSMTIPGYWFVRLMAFEDRAKAARIEFPAFGLWLVLFALSAIEIAVSLFGPSAGAMLGLNEDLVELVRVDSRRGLVDTEHISHCMGSRLASGQSRHRACPFRQADGRFFLANICLRSSLRSAVHGSALWPWIFCHPVRSGVARLADLGAGFAGRSLAGMRYGWRQLCRGAARNTAQIGGTIAGLRGAAQ